MDNLVTLKESELIDEHADPEKVAYESELRNSLLNEHRDLAINSLTKVGAKQRQDGTFLISPGLKAKFLNETTPDIEMTVELQDGDIRVIVPAHEVEATKKRLTNLQIADKAKFKVDEVELLLPVELKLEVLKQSGNGGTIKIEAEQIEEDDDLEFLRILPSV